MKITSLILILKKAVLKIASLIGVKKSLYEVFSLYFLN